MTDEMAGGEVSEDEFEQLYRQARRPLLAYLMRRTTDPQAAADLLAQVFLIAWRRRAVLPPPDERRLWLFGIARKLVAQHYRGVLRDSELTARLAEHLAIQVRAAGSGEEADRVRDALRRLREPDREVLMLTCWEGLSAVEIATVTGRQPGAVRVHLHRARERLRVALADLDANDDPRTADAVITRQRRCLSAEARG